MVKLQFCGAAGTVTGSCYLLDTGKTRLLIDCGLFQGSKSIKERNYGDFPFDPGTIDFVLLTHAHIDHSGLIPKLCRKGFTGPIYATSATIDLCSVLLPDSGHIQEMEIERKNRKRVRAGLLPLEPIYTSQDAQQCIKQFCSVRYSETRKLAHDISVRFQDAGHILGSAMVEIWVSSGRGEEIKIVFSGDIGNTNQPIVNDPSVVSEADYVVMESTYGSRLHHEDENKLDQLRQVIRATFSKGGNLVIPAFAVERTQDLLYHLHLLIEKGEIKGSDIYIDSPLAISATEIFCRNSDYYDQETLELMKRSQGCPLLLNGMQMARTTEESKKINEISGGAIIISASGMCDAGRIKHHLKHNLWRPESSILFVGYQAQGTLGRRILDGEKKVRIHGEEINVAADIYEIKGFSAHADQRGLLDWIKSFKKGKPKTVFVTHGEEEASRTLADIMSMETGIKTIVPKWLDQFSLAPVSAKEDLAAGDKPIWPSIQTAEVREQYEHLLLRLKGLVEKGLQEGQYQSLQDMLQQLDTIIGQIENKRAVN